MCLLYFMWLYMVGFSMFFKLYFMFKSVHLMFQGNFPLGTINLKLKLNCVFLLCKRVLKAVGTFCVLWGIFEIIVPESDRKRAGTDGKSVKDRKWASVRNSLEREQRAHGPQCLWSVRGVCLYRACCSSLLWMRLCSVSVENWIGVDVCTMGRKTAGRKC